MQIKNLVINPAFDKRHADPSKNYGLHGCDMRFELGDTSDCVVQFVLYTNWHLNSVFEEFKDDPKSFLSVGRYPFSFWRAPSPADLGYHCVKPRYDGQTAYDCHVMDGGKCYYDGSGLNAEKVFDVLRAEGSEGVWKFLATYRLDIINS